MKRIISIISLFVLLLVTFLRADLNHQWEYLDNGKIRIGVDKSRGACIGFFGESITKKNLLNNFDEGRFIQQSYYGDKDGSKWNGKPWRYNPVQGGDWKGNKSRILNFSKINGQIITAKVEPLNWSNGKSCPEAIMSLKVSLIDTYAEFTYELEYTGDDQISHNHQEMPAMFVDADLSTLVYPGSDKLIRKIPKWPNEYGKSHKSWFAYLNKNDWGIGIFTPGTKDFTCYRFKGKGKNDPNGSSCSYVAPIRTFSLKKGMKVSYKFYLTIGKLDKIKSSFKSIGG